MQAITSIPLQSMTQQVGVPSSHSLGRLAGQAVFMTELVRAATRQSLHPPSHAAGEPLRPMTFIPLSAQAAPAASGTTSKGKRSKKKSSPASGGDALRNLAGRR